MEYAPKSAMPFALEPLWGDSRRFAGRERADREGCRFDALSPFGHDANGSAAAGFTAKKFIPSRHEQD